MPNVVVDWEYIVEVVREYISVEAGGLCGFYGGQNSVELCLEDILVSGQSF